MSHRLTLDAHDRDVKTLDENADTKASDPTAAGAWSIWWLMRSVTVPLPSSLS
jgi:hypothetical protein